MGIVKRFLIVSLIACLMVGIVPTDVFARGESRWALQTGDVLVGWDGSFQKPQATLFHSSDLSLADMETASLSFPSSLELSPSQNTNIALPSISQRVNETAGATDTGFFNANWCYLNTPNHGGGPVVASDPALAHPHASSPMLGSEFLFPYMTPIGDAAVNFKPIFDNSDTASTVSGDDARIKAPNTFTINDAILVPADKISQAINNTGNQTGNQTGPTLPHGAFKPRIDPKSTKEQINNMSELQRMYRNAFVGTTMHTAYKGTVQSPTWISPNIHPQDVTKMKDHFQTNKDALNMTESGTYLTPVFWDI